MDIGEFDITRLIILILPGLWGLWVYRPLVHTGKDEDRELDYGRAASFGIIGYLVTIWFMGETPKESIPKTLFLLKQFGMSASVSIFLAILLGAASRLWRINLVFLPTKLFSWFFKKTEITANTDRGIDAIWRNYIDHKEIDGKKYTNVAIIYNLSEPENKLVGEIINIPCTNELVIDRSDISAESHAAFLKKLNIDCKVWQRNVNLDNGIITEVVTVEEERFAALEKDFAKTYES